MSLTSEEKNKIFKKFAVQKGDTGSPEVQIGLLSARVKKLAAHLKKHSQDNHSRRGLLAMVSKRRRLLNYLLRKDKKRHQAIASQLNLTK
jgi:small subunit ribosomal protein S15